LQKLPKLAADPAALPVDQKDLFHTTVSVLPMGMDAAGGLYPPRSYRHYTTPPPSIASHFSFFPFFLVFLAIRPEMRYNKGERNKTEETALE
jgi:hypothetical protein